MIFDLGQGVGRMILEMADANVDQQKFKSDGIQMVDVLTILREGELPKTIGPTIGDRIAGIRERDPAWHYQKAEA